MLTNALMLTRLIRLVDENVADYKCDYEVPIFVEFSLGATIEPHLRRAVKFLAVADYIDNEISHYFDLNGSSGPPADMSGLSGPPPDTSRSSGLPPDTSGSSGPPPDTSESVPPAIDWYLVDDGFDTQDSYSDFELPNFSYGWGGHSDWMRLKLSKDDDGSSIYSIVENYVDSNGFIHLKIDSHKGITKAAFGERFDSSRFKFIHSKDDINMCAMCDTPAYIRQTICDYTHHYCFTDDSNTSTLPISTAAQSETTMVGTTMVVPTVVVTDSGTSEFYTPISKFTEVISSTDDSSTSSERETTNSFISSTFSETFTTSTVTETTSTISETFTTSTIKETTLTTTQTATEPYTTSTMTDSTSTVIEANASSLALTDPMTDTDSTTSTIVSDSTSSSTVTDSTSSSTVTASTSSSTVTDSTSSSTVTDSISPSTVTDSTSSSTVTDSTPSSTVADSMSSSTVVESTSSSSVVDSTSFSSNGSSESVSALWSSSFEFSSWSDSFEDWESTMEESISGGDDFCECEDVVEKVATAAIGIVAGGALVVTSEGGIRVFGDDQEIRIKDVGDQLDDAADIGKDVPLAPASDDGSPEDLCVLLSY